MAKTQSNVPVTHPHSTSSTFQSLARPAQRRIASMGATQTWHDFSNMFALGRVKTVKSCHVWVATIAARPRWARLAHGWDVEEVECGCVTGTFDCVFAIRSVET